MDRKLSNQNLHVNNRCAGGPVLPLIDTVNVIGCPTVSAVIGGGGGTTDSTIEQRDNLLRLFLACFRFNWIFISSRSASKSFFISAEILLFNNSSIFRFLSHLPCFSSLEFSILLTFSYHQNQKIP